MPGGDDVKYGDNEEGNRMSNLYDEAPGSRLSAAEIERRAEVSLRVSHERRTAPPPVRFPWSALAMALLVLLAILAALAVLDLHRMGAMG